MSAPDPTLQATSAEALITRDRFDAVGFDLDGVITNTALLHETAWKQLFDEFLGRRVATGAEAFAPFTPDDYREYVDGRPRHDGIRTFLAARKVTLPEGDASDGPDRATVSGLGRRKNELFLQALQHRGVEVYPDGVALIRRLRGLGFKTAVVSASKNCEAVLRTAGIADLFDAKVDGIDQERLGLKGKPAPDTFIEAASRLAVAPARMVVIEDALAGVAAARAGNFGLVLGISRGAESEALKARGADTVLASLSNVVVGASERDETMISRPMQERCVEQPPPEAGPRVAASAPPHESEREDDLAWAFTYEGFEAAVEGQRESLLTLGNGYFATRGAGADAVADGVRYPGTYLAGGYNRLVTDIAGRAIEHEDLVNLPNWLPLQVGAQEGSTASWIGPRTGAEVLLYRRTLDLRRGLLHCVGRFRDAKGRVTRLEATRLVHMREQHLACQRLTITPENWSGRLSVRSAIDGRVANAGVVRYRPFKAQHLQARETAILRDTLLLRTETTQSQLQIAQAARTRLFRGDDPLEADRRDLVDSGYVGQDVSVEVQEGERLTIEKISSLYTSRDRAITDPRTEALTAVSRARRFSTLRESHGLAWEHLWRQCDFDIIRIEGEPSNDTHKIIRLHVFHLLQTVSLHSGDMDVGVPARGWHGEAYRGHVFWDELFIFPFLNMRQPDLTRALLLYRYRRLPEARWAAAQAGLKGAMFPWQSGSNGREETDTVLFNPRSGHFVPDNTHLQRHVNAAIFFNVWQYFRASGDADFLHDHGAEMMLEIARFWASLAQWSSERGRYEIRGVMGPDEFHDAYPGAATPGLNNNAYTNIMAAWCLERALRLFAILPGERCRELCEMLPLDPAELSRWEDISRKMFVPFHGDGIISQFEGYEALDEFDWEAYARKYGNIMRLDLILEAEGDTPNRYKISKQADVLTLFYLFSAEALADIFGRLAYPFTPSMIPKNIDYYLRRTSHGSTLSGIVHAWVFSRSCRPRSWRLFKDALHSDIGDIQGGTTAEGIHLGAMAGTVDLLQRCYAGVELRGEELWFNPSLPHQLSHLGFQLRYQGHALLVDISKDALAVTSQLAVPEPVTVRVKGEARVLRPGERIQFPLPPLPMDEECDKAREEVPADLPSPVPIGATDPTDAGS
ncbi:MAG TPA: HAD-IA family hydrolase [Hyphomicrobiaceae bacterium]|nr:HAD-IA family hydrolase [Hyphomicrobiaceae bacterium]